MAADAAWIGPVLALVVTLHRVIAGGCPTTCLCDLDHVPRTISCTGRALDAFPGNISDVVEYLDLSSNSLTSVSAQVNRLTDLQQLNLSDNKLSSLPLNLRGLVKLRRLDISRNVVGDPSSDLTAIEQLGSLKVLILTGNLLGELEGLKSMSVQVLYADSCGIQILRNTSLSGLPELTQLSLTGNQLKEIRDPYSPKLKGLDLSRCQLKVLTSRAFQGFPELIDLRLADNPALVYSTGFETLRHQKLRKLDVSRCELDRPGLHGLPALTYARLSSNNIRMLPDRIFAKNRELAHLYLDSNHLSRLNKSSFAGLLHLQMIDISSNGLRSVPTTVFRDNYELLFLNLSDNYLVELPRLSSPVVSIDLSFNLITRFESNSLGGMTRLFHLNLSKNLIDELPPALDSSTLRNLVLKRNRISSLENISLSGLPVLEKLDLSENLFRKAIDPEIFYDNSNLEQLNLQDNPWHCDCAEIYPTYVYLKKIQARTDLLICNSPDNVSGYSWKVACSNQWTKQSLRKASNRSWGFLLVAGLSIIVLSGMIISIRHSMKLKRQARNHRLELERTEVRERLRLLQRSMRLQEEQLRGQGPEPRIHPLELISPPSYEEAVTMPRLARSLDALDSVAGENGTRGMGDSAESLRAGKKQRRAGRKARRLRSQSEDNLARRELRREERLRRARQPKTIAATLSKSRMTKLSVKNGTSTDDEDSDDNRQNNKPTRNINRAVDMELSTRRSSTNEGS